MRLGRDSHHEGTKGTKVRAEQVEPTEKNGSRRRQSVLGIMLDSAMRNTKGRLGLSGLSRVLRAFVVVRHPG